MTYSRPFLIIFFILLLPLTMIGQGSPTGQSETAQGITEKVGIGKRMNEFAREFYSQFSQNPLGLEPAKNEQLMNLFAKEFKGEKLLDDFRQELSDKEETDYANAVRQWLGNESVRKVLDAQKDFFTLQGMRKRVINKYELEQNPPDAARINTIQSLDQYTSASKIKENSNAIMFRAILTAFTRISNRQTFSDSQIDNLVDNYRVRMLPQVKQDMQEELLTMYHKIDNGTLKKFIGFYKTDSGRWLNTTTLACADSAFSNAADRFLSSMNNMTSDQ